ncbi:hypothetical protein Cni_G26517 [Canna indica]|uniref:Transcription repressor n=1 Tax=Canna indica TaxID=4628 RepID=A0AAQ3KZW9_9LILI|nr:hypothetical protein Cni_G26517 [Canna indica]
MSSSTRRKIHLRHPAVVVDIGCNCRKPKLSSLFSFPSKPKPNKPSTTYISSLASFNEETHPSPPAPPPPAEQQQQQQQGARRRRKKKNGRVARESVAVVKETSEPYTDFKESMARMIVEKEIYGWDDLNDLLHRFLSLNSPRHHHLILRAFGDLWNGVFSPASALTGVEEDASPPPYYIY